MMLLVSLFASSSVGDGCLSRLQAKLFVLPLSSNCQPHDITPQWDTRPFCIPMMWVQALQAGAACPHVVSQGLAATRAGSGSSAPWELLHGLGPSTGERGLLFLQWHWLLLQLLRSHSCSAGDTGLSAAQLLALQALPSSALAL